MKRLLLLLLPLLTACGLFGTPPTLRPAGTEPQPVTVLGVPIRYRVLTTQAEMVAVLGRDPGVGISGLSKREPDGLCNIWLRSDSALNAFVVAHEVGHCAAAPHDYSEETANAYAARYVAACSDSVRPLGLLDYRVPRCAEAPALGGRK